MTKFGGYYSYYINGIEEGSFGAVTVQVECCFDAFTVEMAFLLTKGLIFFDFFLIFFVHSGTTVVSSMVNFSSEVVAFPLLHLFGVQ